MDAPVSFDSRSFDGQSFDSHSENCHCGHSLEMHRHHRPGSDCSECTGALQCARFRTADTDAALIGLQFELPALVG